MFYATKCGGFLRSRSARHHPARCWRPRPPLPVALLCFTVFHWSCPAWTDHTEPHICSSIVLPLTASARKCGDAVAFARHSPYFRHVKWQVPEQFSATRTRMDTRRMACVSADAAVSACHQSCECPSFSQSWASWDSAPYDSPPSLPYAQHGGSLSLRAQVTGHVYKSIYSFILQTFIICLHHARHSTRSQGGRRKYIKRLLLLREEERTPAESHGGRVLNAAPGAFGAKGDVGWVSNNE